MTSPRITVPVDEQVIKRLQEEADHPGLGDSVMVFGPDLRALLRAYRSLSAAPAPEGGVVDDGAIKIATDLHKAYEQLIYGMPRYLDAENLTDEENMIREAWITLDATAHRLAALATREEAPAEAGEDDVRGLIGEAIQGLERAIASTRYDSASKEVFAACVDDFRKVLRAFMQAREDAQPYGWIYERFDVGSGWCAPNEWHPAQFTRTPPKPETSRNVITLYTHPAPDALREAVEALEPFARAADKLDGHWSEDDWRWNDSVLSGVTVRDIRRARQVRAALQAEQKGGA